MHVYKLQEALHKTNWKQAGAAPAHLSDARAAAVQAVVDSNAGRRQRLPVPAAVLENDGSDPLEPKASDPAEEEQAKEEAQNIIASQAANMCPPSAATATSSSGVAVANASPSMATTSSLLSDLSRSQAPSAASTQCAQSSTSSSTSSPATGQPRALPASMAGMFMGILCVAHAATLIHDVFLDQLPLRVSPPQCLLNLVARLQSTLTQRSNELLLLWQIA